MEAFREHGYTMLELILTQESSPAQKTDNLEIRLLQELPAAVEARL